MKIVEVTLALACLIFSAAVLCGALYLWRRKVKYERWSFMAVRWGLPFLTLHLLLSSIRDYRFSGIAWSWEPRQIALWMLWVYFAMNLHLARPNRKTAMVTCLGSLLIVGAVLKGLR